MKNKYKIFIVLLLAIVLFNLILVLKTHASYNAGLGINVGTMGKDITIGLTMHNIIDNSYMINLYGSWDYRFWGYQSWTPTGSIGIGFGGMKSLVNLKKPVYWDKAKKKYFQALGVGATFDIEQKFSKDAYIGGRYGAALWGQLNRNMLGLSLGIDHTRMIGLGMYGKVQYSFLLGK